jgi:hypothetical protein
LSLKALAELQKRHAMELSEERPVFLDEDRVSKAIGHIKETGNYEVFIRRSSKIAMANLRDFLSASDRPDTTKLGNISYLAPLLRREGAIVEAARLMHDYRQRAIPIEGTNGVIQVVSARRLAAETLHLGKMSVQASAIMKPNPVVISPTDPAAKARSLMLQRSFDHLPVVEDSKLRGIVTSRDILMNLPRDRRIPRGAPFGGAPPKEMGLHYPVSRIAATAPLQIEPDAAFSDALGKMLDGRSSYILVTLWGELQGIVTLRDVTQSLVKKEKSEAPYYIVGLPDEPFEAEAAKMKFGRLASLISRAYPFVEEVRAVIKTKEISKDRRRYEVSVHVDTPKSVYSYSENGYDLSEIFDALVPKIKKLLSSRTSKVTKSGGASMRKDAGAYTVVS